jgi:hypothetical protein
MRIRCSSRKSIVDVFAFVRLSATGHQNEREVKELYCFDTVTAICVCWLVETFDAMQPEPMKYLSNAMSSSLCQECFLLRVKSDLLLL